MSFPYADTGARDELRSVGWSDTRNVHNDNKNTTYVRDYTGEEPTLQGYGTTFKAGLLTNADIGSVQGGVSKATSQSSRAYNPTYNQKNTTYMGVGKTQAFDGDRKNPIRKGPGRVSGQTIQKRDFQDRGLAGNPLVDDNQFYTNNFNKQPRGVDVNSHINKTTMVKDYTHPGEPRNIVKNPKVKVPGRKRKGVNKKTEYTGKYQQPGYNRLKFQTTNKRGLNYANRFANKPRMHNIDTAYANDYKVHQQRVMAALNKMN
jgi:hypothetical protein